MASSPLQNSTAASENAGLFRRRFDRMRGNGDAQAPTDSLDDRDSLRLEVMLLREEVARLRAERHRSADIGTLIDQLRELGAGSGEADMEDEVWSLLAEMMVFREGLEQACIELESAVGAVRRHLGSLSVKLDQSGLGRDTESPRLPAPGADSG
ncbi:MAG TPA: hypothetical protein VEF89_20380 [Solirubrobacteraceae bacterium]|nr:hypothetical protein [Solirubrobacteraceae bacterium]